MIKMVLNYLVSAKYCLELCQIFVGYPLHCHL